MKMTLSVQQFFEKYAQELCLKIIAGEEGLSKRVITLPEIHRAGLFLTGKVSGYQKNRLLVLGRVELNYLEQFSPLEQKKRLEHVFREETPAVFLPDETSPHPGLIELCHQKQLPVFKTSLPMFEIINQMAVILKDEFTPIASRHGTFVEVFDIGVLIEGDSAIGKSETALGLIERGHRLISDDIVRVKKDREGFLEGQGVELTRHHMEIRGIGIINVANLYGAFCVRDKKRINLIVKLEAWNDQNFYDRIGTEGKTCSILGVDVPFSILPVRPGRDVVLLIEALALNYRLKVMGYHSADEFKQRLNQKIAEKQKKRTPFYETREKSSSQ